MESLVNALTESSAVAATARAEDFAGMVACARCYVCLSGPGYRALTKKERAAVDAWAKANGMRFQARGYYGLRDALYVGYDNADGDVIAKADAFAAAFRFTKTVDPAFSYSAHAEFGMD